MSESTDRERSASAAPAVELGPPRPDELAAVLALLAGAALPGAGVAEHFGDFVVARAGNRLVGAAGLERYGASGLLRSVVVAPGHRGRGVGAALVRQVMAAAAAGGIERLYLLTTAAAGFFARLGFRPVEREAVEAAVRASTEFAAACCATAVAMRLDLTPAGQVPAVPLTPRVHVHLSVTDLERSRAFYERFFGTPPVKVRSGYVKFLPPWGPLNLALSSGRPAAAGPVNHLGIQLGSRADVVRELARIRAAGLPVREEMGVDCCHANQDKFWVEDPDGVEWEVYVLNRDLDDEPASAALRALPAAAPGACCGR